MASIRITDKCVGCKKCLSACPFGAIVMEGKRACITDNCTLCGVCPSSCPFEAIDFQKDEEAVRDLSAYRGVWVFAEEFEGRVLGVAYELLAQARALAEDLNTEVTALLFSPDGAENAQKLIARGADKVFLAEDARLAHRDDQYYTDIMAELAEEHKPDIILMGATAFGRSLAPRVAARLRTGLTADCTFLSIDKDSGLLEQTRPAFGGNLMATIVCPQHRPQMATVRPRVFKALEADTGRSGEIVRLAPRLTEQPWMQHLALHKAEEEGLSIAEADIIVAAGRGLCSGKDLDLAKELAELLGGALACSRPLVDGGLVSYRHQVGQTGKTVSPKLYLAFGISGAIQHLAGIGGAETIVAVNKDPEAPIFKVAHYCIVGDSVEVLQAMLQEVKERKAAQG